MQGGRQGSEIPFVMLLSQGRHRRKRVGFARYRVLRGSLSASHFWEVLRKSGEAAKAGGTTNRPFVLQMDGGVF